MTQQARSRSTSRNPDFKPLKRGRQHGNLQWGDLAAREMRAAGPDEWTYIVLLGGADTLSYRLRVAQSHLRPDMLPSYWSHALLVLLNDASLGGAQAVHVPLLQPDGPAYAPKNNGVITEALSAFDDPARYPNIALLALPIAQARIEARVEAFKRSRPTLDALEHALRWLVFAWGVVKIGNPLHDNYGLPSACMLETVCAAEEFDLTPGLESRASCPEAIWTAARYWHEYFQQTGGKVPFGRYAITHSYPILELPDGPAPLPSPPPAAKRGKQDRK